MRPPRAISRELLEDRDLLAPFGVGDEVRRVDGSGGLIVTGVVVGVDRQRGYPLDDAGSEALSQAIRVRIGTGPVLTYDWREWEPVRRGAPRPDTSGGDRPCPYAVGDRVRTVGFGPVRTGTIVAVTESRSPREHGCFGRAYQLIEVRWADATDPTLLPWHQVVLE